jgi:hypothetical protein
MAPQEVAGLHALAKAHGGSLTTNPDTGLPEAGFLSSLLPMIIGGALAATGVGAPLAAAMVGGGYGLATGSLSKGLMAGMGAFGGAGLAGGLMGAGAAGAAGTGGVMGANPMIAQPMTFGAETLGSGANLGTAAITPDIMGGTAGQVGSAYGYAPPAAGAIPPPAAAPIQAQQAVMQAAPQTVTPIADRFSQLGQGFKSLGTEAGREAFMGTAATKTAEATRMGGLGGLAKYGMAAASPVMADMMTPKPYQKPAEEKPYEYTYSSGRRENPDEGYTGAETGERNYFDHRFTRKAAGGGLMDIQPVDAMSRQNQLQMQPAYAQGGVSDMAVNPYTGSESFAEGGDTAAPPPKAVRPVEQDPYNTMTGQSADMYKYLMGQGPRPTAPGQPPAPGTGPITTMPVSPFPPAPAPPPAPGMGNFFKKTLPATPPAPETGNFLKKTLLGGGRSDEPLQKRYTFDPVTGGFTALAPAEADYAAPETTTPVNTWENGMGYAHGGIASLAQGGPSHLGDYSDGGRLLRGPGDGVSDSIPASIGDKRPARLADGEFVVPARIVSELGNGSTEAGARKLYAMMDRVQKARAKTTGKNRVAANTKAERLLPV